MTLVPNGTVGLDLVSTVAFFAKKVHHRKIAAKNDKLVFRNKAVSVKCKKSTQFKDFCLKNAVETATFFH